MKLVELLPWIIAALVIVIMVLVGSKYRISGRHAWMVPAALSAMFAACSVVTVVIEGPTGFWREHTRNLWGNQIFFDLLLAASIGWYLIVPPAKLLGMRVTLWLLLILCTGSIGFLAMLARLMYLRPSRPPSSVSGISEN